MRTRIANALCCLAALIVGGRAKPWMLVKAAGQFAVTLPVDICDRARLVYR